jgi:cytochrome b561
LVFGIERAFAAQGRQEAPQPMANRAARLGEWAFVALTLALAAAGRLVLAAHGWPNFNSDESIVGLMTNDIMRHGAHPVFFYGQNYMGAL